MKKFLIILLTIGLLIGGGALYFFVLRGIIKDYPSSARALPSDAFVIYKGDNFQSTFKGFRKTSLIRGISRDSGFIKLNQQFNNLDSLVNQSDKARNFLQKNPLHISLHNVAVDKLSLLFLLQTNQLNTSNQVKSLINEKCKKCWFETREFNGYTIIDVLTGINEPIFSFSTIEGILAISPNSILVENAIRSFVNRQGQSLDGVIKAAKRSKGQEKLLVNFEQLPTFLGTFTDHRPRHFLKKKGILNGYGAYDIQFQGTSLQLHGNLKVNKNTPLLSHIKKQTPNNSYIPEVLPSRTAFFHSFKMSDYGAYFEDLKQYHKNKGTYLKFKHYKDSLETKGDFSIKEDFLPILGDEIALVVNEPVSEEFKRNVFIAMHCKNANSSYKMLGNLAGQIEKGAYSTTSPIQYRDQTIQRIPIGGIFPFLFGDFFNAIHQPFYVKLDDFILFASSSETLKRVIDDYEANQTLKSSSHYTRLQQHLLSETNLFFYLNPERSLMLPFNYLKESLKDPYRKDFKYYRNFGALAFQLATNDKSFFSQLTIQKASTTTNTTEKLWEQKVDTTLAMPPQIVVNHENNEKEIFLVDQKNQVYLMSNSGSILWSRKLKSKVMGKVDQIDLYKNGNLQYLFATQNQLQLIDRKGRNVASFPISISAPASTELVAFDYYGNKNYRYFIGCRNHNIYGYYPTGSPLGGWSPKRVDAPLDHPMKYFRYNGKTYLYGVTEKGTFYLWNKDGDRIHKFPFKTRFPNNFRIHFGDVDSTTYMVSADTSGIAHFVYLNGKIRKQHYGKIKGDHYFNLLNLNNDDKKELIFSKSTTIKGFHKDSTEVFSLTLADTLSYSPQFFTIEGKSYIGYVSQKTGQIFMVDLDGTFYQGFPLKGSTPFYINDVNNDGVRELVVGANNGKTILYRIN